MLTFDNLKPKKTSDCWQNGNFRQGQNLRKPKIMWENVGLDYSINTISEPLGCGQMWAY